MKKYIISLAIVLLIAISSKLYAPAVQVSKGESEKKYKRALELIDKIAKNAIRGIFSDEDTRELKTLTPYLGSSKQYAGLVEALKKVPAPLVPKTEQEKQVMELYKKPGLKPEDLPKQVTVAPGTPAPAPVTTPKTTVPMPASVKVPPTPQTPQVQTPVQQVQTQAPIMAPSAAPQIQTPAPITTIKK